MSVPTPLAGLESGATATVIGIEAEPHLVARLCSMGILDGTLLRVIKRAPLGDPMLVEFDGQQLSLRRAEALAVRVEKV